MNDEWVDRLNDAWAKAGIDVRAEVLLTETFRRDASGCWVVEEAHEEDGETVVTLKPERPIVVRDGDTMGGIPMPVSWPEK